MLSVSILLLLILIHFVPRNIPILAAASYFDPRFPTNPFWNPRGDPENRLFCPAPLPQRNYGHRATMPNVPIAIEYLPSKFDWSHHNFSSLHDLCSMTGNPRGNMGGFCKENADRTVTPAWRTTRARAVLLYDPALDAYCRANCTCASSEDDYYALDLHENIVKHNLPPLPSPIYRNPWPPYQIPNHPANYPYPPRYRGADARKYNWLHREVGESSTRLSACRPGFVRCYGREVGGRETSGLKGGRQPGRAPAKTCYCTYNRPGGVHPAAIPRPALPRVGSSPPRAGALPVH